MTAGPPAPDAAALDTAFRDGESSYVEASA